MSKFTISTAALATSFTSGADALPRSGRHEAATA